MGNAGYVLEIYGTGSLPAGGAGTFSRGTDSTVKYTGTGTTTTIATTAYHHLEFAPTSATTFELSGNLTASKAISGNLTIGANTTLDTVSASNYGINVDGNLDQTATTSTLLGNSSTIQVGGNIDLDGTVSSTNLNNTTLIMTGTGTALTYSNVSSPWNNGVYGLGVGQAGKTHTISGNFAATNELNVGTGEVTGTANIYLRGESDPLVFVSSSNVSVASLRFNGLAQNIPTLSNGYDTDLYFIRDSMVATQTGNVTLNTGKHMYINGNDTDANVVTYNTDGYDLTIAGNLTIGGTGTDTGLKKLDATNGTGGNSTISVAGNYTVTAGTNDFVADTSTVILNGTGTQAITSGGDAFNNLTVNNASDVVIFSDAFSTANFTATTADTQLTFTGGATYNISGTLDLNGQASGTEVLLRSTDTSQYIFNVTGGAQAVSYVDVQYSAASGNNITASNSIDGVGNDDGTGSPHWIFSYALAGTVYSGEGSGALANMTIRLVINGTDNGTAETNPAGEYGFDTSFVATDKILVFIDTETENGNTVTIANGSTLSGLDIYQNRLIVRHDSAGPISNANLESAYTSYPGAAHADLLYSVSTNNLTMDTNTELFIWSGDTYTPGGEVNAHDLDINGTFTAAANAINVSGSWDNDASATFTSSGTTTFTSVDTGETITTGGDAFSTVAFDSADASGGWILQDALSSSVLTVTDGTLTDNAQTVTVDGNITIPNTSSVLASTGTWILGANGNIENPHNTNTFKELQLDASVTATLTALVNTNSITVGNSSSASGSTLVLRPDADNFMTVGTGTSLGMTVQIIPAVALVSQSALTTDAALTMGLVATGTTIRMTGDWSVDTITIYGHATSTSEGTAAVLDTNGYNLTTTSTTQGIRLGSTHSSFPNGYQSKVLFGSGIHSIGSKLYVKQGTGGTTGYINLGSANISVAGDIDFTSATVTPGTSTVTLNSSSADQTITNAGQSFNNLTLNNTASSGSDDIIISGALDVNGILTITDGDLDISTNDPAVNTAGNVSIGASGTIDVSSRSANWTFDGTSSLTDSSSGQDFEDVVINGTSLTLGSNAKVETMTITAGTLDLASSSYVLEIDGTGTPLSNSGTFTAGTSTVKYTGTGSATNIATVAYNNLQLTPTAAITYSLTGNLTAGNALTGNLTLDANATLDATGTNYGVTAVDITINGTYTAQGSTITFSGNWDNNGTFTAGTSSVVLNGASQQLYGSATFNDLTKSVTSAATLTFEAGQTTTIGGAVTLNGASGQLLTLASSTGSSAWNFTVNSGATKSISYVSVSWSDASGSDVSQKPINPSNYTDGGDTTDWFITTSPTITILKDSSVVGGGYYIPGNTIEYSITVTNSGDGSPDVDTVVVDDDIDNTTIEFDTTFTPTFTDGGTSSSLSITIGSDVVYSDDSGSTWTYTPVGSYDPNVTNIKFPMTGTFSHSGASFTLKYRARIQ
ncbi:beta strand repeat-containing protein [Pseudomonadota bacterium]